MEEESHILDIDDYNLDDLLKLFNLNYNFNKEDLKNAWRICLKTHPDKSGLDSDYFLFYKKAYKIISEVYYFRATKTQNTEYILEKNKEHKELLKPYQNKTNFNKWFNEMFTKIKIQDGEHDHGYEKWLGNIVEKDPQKVKLSEFNQEFYKLKKNSQALVKHHQINDINMNCGYNLLRDKQENYSSNIFSKLKFEDLKKAHTENVIPITKDDVHLRQKYGSLNELKNSRININPLSTQKANQILMKQYETEKRGNVLRAYKILKQDEISEKVNDQWWAYLKQLGSE